MPRASTQRGPACLYWADRALDATATTTELSVRVKTQDVSPSWRPLIDHVRLGKTPDSCSFAAVVGRGGVGEAGSGVWGPGSGRRYAYYVNDVPVPSLTFRLVCSSRSQEHSEEMNAHGFLHQSSFSKDFMLILFNHPVSPSPPSPLPCSSSPVFGPSPRRNTASADNMLDVEGLAGRSPVVHDRRHGRLRLQAGGAGTLAQHPARRRSPPSLSFVADRRPPARRKFRSKRRRRRRR